MTRSRRCAVFGASCLLALSCAPALSSQSYQWVQNPANGHLYTITVPMPWDAAEAEAQRLGCHLVTVRSQAEHDWLIQEFGTGRAWIGLNDVAQEGTYEWVSGSTSTFRTWAPGEPNSHTPDEDAVEMVSWSNGRWNDQETTDWLAGIVEWVPGESHSLELDGVDAMGQAVWPGHAAAPLAGTTFEGWVRLGSPDGRNYRAPLLSREGLNSTAHPAIRTSDGAVFPWHVDFPRPCLDPVAFLTFGEWHHLAVVIGTGSVLPMTLFVDGRSVSACSGFWTSFADSPMTLGAWQQGGAHTRHLAAEVDELRVSSVQRYSVDFVPERRFVPDADTMVLWHFDEGAGSIAHDSSGNDRHLTLTGGYAWLPYGLNSTGFPIGADYVAYRSSCDSSAGTPELTCPVLPRVGRSVDLRVAGLGANKVGYLLFGLQDQSWGMSPLPLDLATVGAPGCFVNIDPVMQIGVPSDASGTARASFSIANAPALAGVEFFNQFVSLDDAPVGRALQIATTNAGRGVVGL